MIFCFLSALKFSTEKSERSLRTSAQPPNFQPGGRRGASTHLQRAFCLKPTIISPAINSTSSPPAIAALHKVKIINSFRLMWATGRRTHIHAHVLKETNQHLANALKKKKKSNRPKDLVEGIRFYSYLPRNYSTRKEVLIGATVTCIPLWIQPASLVSPYITPNRWRVIALSLSSHPSPPGSRSIMLERFQGIDRAGRTAAICRLQHGLTAVTPLVFFVSL